MSCDPVRRRALDVLLAVAQGADLDRELDAALGRVDAPRDAGFLAELVRGTVQWQGRYDHVIASFSRKRPPSDATLVAILRLSLHQLLTLDGVPPYAAVNEAAELCRATRGRGKVGFINGMLQAVRRQVLADGPEGREQALRRIFEPLESDRPRWLSAWYSLPQWLVTRWIGAYGDRRAEALCAATNEAPRVHLHVAGDGDPKDLVEPLAAAGLQALPGAAPRCLTVAERVPRARLAELLAAHPELVVQDVAVQEATAWLADGLQPAGPLVDLCAAPGGKTVHLAGRLPGVPLVAMDDRPARMDLLRGTVERAARGRVALVQADAAHPPFADGSCGGILLDGPCSGTGVLRHHPDGRWRLKPQVPARKAIVLVAMARAAAAALAPGGRLMYATCSLEREENEDVIAALRAACPELEPATDREGRWQRRWLPDEAHGETALGPLCGDGFFAARLRRRSA